MKDQKFLISFYCYYPESQTPCKKEQEIKLSDIPRWIDSYKFTHPNCKSIAIKIWFSDLEKLNNE